VEEGKPFGIFILIKLGKMAGGRAGRREREVFLQPVLTIR
jgi:hypothetical protein